MNNETLSMIFYTNLKDSNNVSRDLNQVVENICSILVRSQNSFVARNLSKTFGTSLQQP